MRHASVGLDLRKLDPLSPIITPTDMTLPTLVRLRSVLDLDRISIGQLRSDTHLQVVAETLREAALPPLLSSSLALNDLLPLPYEHVFRFRMGAMMNVERKTVFHIPAIQVEAPAIKLNRLTHLSARSPALKTLKAMGVHFSCMMPIFYEDSPWGLLMAHNIQPTFLLPQKLETLGIVLNELSLQLGPQAQQHRHHLQAEHDTILTQLNEILQSSPQPPLQDALDATVVALQGVGGRLCLRNPNPDAPNSSGQDLTECLAAATPPIDVYTCGLQPPFGINADKALMEPYHRWRVQQANGHPDVWVIGNLYDTPELASLYQVFKTTPIQGLVLIPLVYRQHLLGYGCVFRDWATASSPDRATADLAKRLAQHFSRAIYEYELLQHMDASRTRLNTELHQQSTHLTQVAKQQDSLANILAEIQTSNDLEVTLKRATRALCWALEAERVAVYRFSANWGGSFVHDLGYSVPQWIRAFKLGTNTLWNDTYLQDTEGGRFRHHETLVVDDVHHAGLTSCHVDIYDQFKIKAFATAPVFIAKRLWGILGVYQHSHTRQWKSTDVQFLTQTASALGLALQRAELLNVTSGSSLRYPSWLDKLEMPSAESP